jgi:oligoribonuclease (3'-5' exoribonuclease)
MMKEYSVRNHNGTLLGEFDDVKEAIAEMRYYRQETGNIAYVERNHAEGEDK